MNRSWRHQLGAALGLRFGWRAQFLLSGEDRLTVERLLSTTRLFLAALALVTLYMEPHGPPWLRPVVHGLLVAYAVFAASVVILLRVRSEWILRARDVIHMGDVALAAIVTVMTNGPSSPFFVFFLYGLLAAALRWGFRATAFTGAAITMWYAFETVGFARIASEPLEPSTIVLRIAYLLIATVLLASLAGTQGTFHPERDVLSRMLARVMRSSSYRQSVEDALRELIDFTDARSAVLALQQIDSGRIYAWTLPRTGGITLTEERETDGIRWFFTMPADVIAWIVERRRSGLRVRGIGTEGNVVLDQDDLSQHRAMLGRTGSTVLVALSTHTPGWRARLYLFDPTCRHESDVRLLHHVVTQAGPALHGHYMIARLRTTIIEVARARISRELHDRLLQSLIGLEMEMEALRRRAETLPSVVRRDLPTIQQHLHEAILDTRDLMTEMRPRVSEGGVLGAVGEMMQRFRSDTGIEAVLSTDVQNVDASPRISAELVRIVQEALTNIRKHSRARHVHVHFGRVNGSWTLSIEDDGQGFAFTGTQSLAELEFTRRGPLVIEERVRAIGGDLRLQSEPGKGARLEVIWCDARGRTPKESIAHV